MWLLAIGYAVTGLSVAARIAVLLMREEYRQSYSHRLDGFMVTMHCLVGLFCGACWPVVGPFLVFRHFVMVRFQIEQESEAVDR